MASLPPSSVKRRMVRTVDTIATRCASTPVLRDLATAASWVLLGAFFILINDFVRADYPALDLVLMTYQDVGIVTGFWFAWPARLKSLFIVFSILRLAETKKQQLFSQSASSQHSVSATSSTHSQSAHFFHLAQSENMS